jgi:hypothetical protein
MIFNAFQKEDDDALFTVVRNVSGGAFALGQSCVWDVTSPDGVRVSVPATATLSLFKGVFADPVADSGYGKVQVGGYCSYGSVIQDTAGGTNIAAGDILVPVNGQKYLARSAASDGKSGFVYAGEAFVTATTPAAASKKIFLRAL